MSLSNGAHGVTVNTQVCGTCNSGSIPGGHPKIMRRTSLFGDYIFGVLNGNRKTEAVYKMSVANACR